MKLKNSGIVNEDSDAYKNNHTMVRDWRICRRAAAGIGAQAQDYPVRPIQVIVPFAGGSASDVVTRIMLDRMAKTLGQPFIVDNRPGAGGNTGTWRRSKPRPTATRW